MNDVTLFEAKGVTVSREKTGYRLASPLMNGGSVFLRRSNGTQADADFGVIAGTKKPSLLKSGAEKIANACGMLQHYTIETKIEDVEKALFFYTVKCELCKISADGKEYVFYTGYGSANTMERQVGRQSGFDAANARLKMAQKRALVSAVISMGGLSDLFTQDMENDDFMRTFDEVKQTVNPEAPLTNQMGKNLYTIAYAEGYTVAEANKKLKEAGFGSPKDIKQKDFDAACAIFKKEDK